MLLKAIGELTFLRDFMVCRLYLVISIINSINLLSAEPLFRVYKKDARVSWQIGSDSESI